MDEHGGIVKNNILIINAGSSKVSEVCDRTQGSPRHETY